LGVVFSIWSEPRLVYQGHQPKIAQRHIEERGLLDASQFGVRARYSTTPQCMRLMDHITLNLNNNMSTAVVFMDIEKAFNMAWHISLPYKLLELKFLISLIKLIGSFLRENSVEGEISTLRTCRGTTKFCPVPHIVQCVCACTCMHTRVHTYRYINDSPKHMVSIWVSADDACVYATDCKEGYVLRKRNKVSVLLRRVVSART
jgi:hypothetical protein